MTWANGIGLMPWFRPLARAMGASIYQLQANGPKLGAALFSGKSVKIGLVCPGLIGGSGTSA